VPNGSTRFAQRVSRRILASKVGNLLEFAEDAEGTECFQSAAEKAVLDAEKARRKAEKEAASSAE
jgi:hypothetical protein